MFQDKRDTRIDCATANAALEPLSALERIRWAVDALADDVVLLSSMQKTAVVLMHLFHRLGLSNEVLFVDTGYHFFETLKMRDAYMRRYRLNVVTLYPASTIEEQETLHGSKLFTSIAGQPECCRMRKEAPLLAHLATKRAPVLVNGLRRAEGGSGATSSPSAKIAARAATSCRRSTTGAVTTSARTSTSTICSFTRCTTRATRASAATRARRRCARRGRPRRPVAPPAIAEPRTGPRYCGINFSDGGGIECHDGWFADNARTIGRTPLVRLNRVTDGAPATILAKIEGRNPAYSVKCRIGAAMVWDAEKRGVLDRGQGADRAHQRQHGHRARLRRGRARLPADADDARNDEHRAPQAARGLRGQAGPHRRRARDGGAVAKAEAIAASAPDRYVLLQQFKNPANPRIHETTTGPEIWDDTGGAVDIFVSGVGTGGTITGVSRYIKHTRGKPIVSVAVEPDASPVLTQTRAGAPLQPAPHRIQGIGAGFVPDVLDLSLVDAIEQVSNEEAIAYARRLAREEGILSGISCGAAVAVAVRIARRRENEGKTIVDRAARLGRALPELAPVRGRVRRAGLFGRQARELSQVVRPREDRGVNSNFRCGRSWLRARPAWEAITPTRAATASPVRLPCVRRSAPI